MITFGLVGIPHIMYTAENHPQEVHRAVPHRQRNACNMCKDCFDRLLQFSAGALIYAGATYIHTSLDVNQYGCKKLVHDPTRDTDFLIGNICCALCGAGGAVYSLYEFFQMTVDVFNFAKKHKKLFEICFCKRLEQYLEAEERPSIENPTPINPAQQQV
jgi:hypothetical protein